MEKEAVICAVLVFITASAGVSQNSKITCPRPFYKEGSSALNLTIDSSTFSGCNFGPEAVTCSWYPQTGTESVICIQSVTSCDQTLTNRGCRCNSVSGQVYDYSLSFYMFPGEERGNISCSLDCIVTPGNQGPKATVESDQTCLNIDLVSKCETFGCQAGVCRIDGTEPICDCTGTDYEGTHCEVDLCKGYDCNGGTCYIQNRTANCDCPNGYTGDHCQVDLCKGYDCNGGMCYIQKRTANCDCPNGYTGDHCQELNPLLIALICVSSLLGVVMAAGGAGVYCAGKQRSGGQHNAPPADAPPANAPLANAPQVNYNTPPGNAPPDNAPQVAGSAGPSTGQTVQSTPYDEPDQSSIAGSEASEGTEYNASEVSDV